jgi:hypothetical protein
MIHHNDQFVATESGIFSQTLFHKLGTEERVEIRFKGLGAEHMERKFFVDSGKAMRFALRLRQAHDVYVGVAPRLGEVGTKEGVTRLLAVWGDLDVKGEHTKESRLDQLERLLCPPSMLVWSGGGYHPYWMLRDSIQGPEELARAEKVMQRIAEGLDGDAVYDRSRILRIPGTLNHKLEDPRPVRLVHHDPEQRYTLDQLEEMVEPWAQAKKITTPKDECRTSREVAERFLEGTRNNTLISLAGSMRHRGMSEEAILAALKVENENRCDPPLPEDEVRSVARSIGKYEAGDPLYGTSNSTAFPVEVLPPTLRKYVEEASASIGCPPDFIGVAMLATLGAAIGNSRVIEVKGGWIEGASLYTAIVGDPGSSKTPALKAATFPALKKQEELKRLYEEVRSEYGATEPNNMDEPVFQRSVVQDTTVEALAERLGENLRGLLSSNDELSGWIRGMDQYKGGKGSDRQFWLSAWSNSPSIVDRKGKAPIVIPCPFVAVAGGIQPGILSEIKNNREDGLLDRFLFGYPNPMPKRWNDTEVGKGTKAAYKGIYDELYGLGMDTDENGTPDPIKATFTPWAKKLFAKNYDSLQEEMEQTDFPAHLKGPWSKMSGYLARLSLIICMADTVEPRPQPYVEGFNEIFKANPIITKNHVEAAIELMDYFKAHTRKVYAKLSDPGKSSTKQFKEDKGGETDKGNSVAHFLNRFLEERGGYWEGTTSRLYEICKAGSISGLPGGSNIFGKQIRKIARDPDSGFTLKEGFSGKQPIIKLSLSTLGTVGSTSDTDTETTEGTKGRNGGESVTSTLGADVREDYLVKIADAMERLYEEHPEHQGERDAELIATELFWWGYLDYIPTDAEVEQVLNSR